MTISSPFGVLHAVLDGAGYQFPGFSQKPGAANMPTNEPLTMTWTQQSWRPDFKKASALGVEGTFWRASNAEEMDPTYPAAVESAIAAGQKHTGYGYLRNDRLPATEGAKVFLEALKQAPPPTLRPMADVEDFTGQEKWTPRAKADYIHTWMGVVGDAFGVAPVLYGPAWWLDRELGPLAAEMDRYEVMLSHYIHHGQVPPSQHTEWYKWCSTTQNGDAGIAWGRSAQGVLSREGWQFTSEGKGPDFGVASTWVDLNMVTDAAWNRWLIASAMPPPPNTIRVPQTQSIVQWAPHECNVLAGVLNVFLAGAGKIGVGMPGKFTPEMDVAVRWFQSGRSLKVDGVCGPATWAALIPSEVK